MANLDSTAEILKLVLHKSGELSDGTSEFQDIALTYINEVYQKIVAGSNEYNLDVGKPWRWAKSQTPIILTLLPPYSTGGVTLTNNSTAGVFSVPPSASQAGNWLFVDGCFEVFKILTHVAGSPNFVLDGIFTETSVVVSDFKSIQLDYTITATEIAGIQRLAGPMQVHRGQTFDNDQEGKIYENDINQMRKKYPIEQITLGTPTEFAVTSEKDGVLYVRFNKYVDTMTRVEIDYIPVPADLTDSPDSTPIIPRSFRDILVYLPASQICADKSDDRVDRYVAQGNKILSSMMIADTKQIDDNSKARGQMVPRPDLLKQKTKIYTY